MSQAEVPEVTRDISETTVYPDGSRDVAEGVVLCEHFMEVSVNTYPAVRLSCTPSYLNELVTGRLYTEGIIDSYDEISRLFICKTGSIADVILSKDIEPVDHVYNEMTCCTGNIQLLAVKGSRSPEHLGTVAPDDAAVFELAARFAGDSRLHRKTGGTHSCYLRTPAGDILEFEDISRHNAVDKAAGYALINGIDPSGCLVYTTGRVPEDMVRKCIMAKFPVLISKSVATDAAVKLAGEYGLKLICCAWPDSYKIISIRDESHEE